MSIIDTLITDRKPDHAERLAFLSSIPWDDMTQEQQYEWMYGEADEALYWQDGEIMRCIDGPLYIHNADGTHKGAYNWKDLNRVCEAMEYLFLRFSDAGYSFPYKRSTPAETRLEWQMEDIPTHGQMAQYLKNAQSIRDLPLSLKTTPQLPAAMEDLSTDGANAIEKVLIELDAQLTLTQKILIRSNMPWAVSGAPGIYAVN